MLMMAHDINGITVMRDNWWHGTRVAGKTNYQYRYAPPALCIGGAHTCLLGHGGGMAMHRVPDCLNQDLDVLYHLVDTLISWLTGW